MFLHFPFALLVLSAEAIIRVSTVFEMTDSRTLLELEPLMLMKTSLARHFRALHVFLPDLCSLYVLLIYR